MIRNRLYKNTLIFSMICTLALHATAIQPSTSSTTKTTKNKASTKPKKMVQYNTSLGIQPPKTPTTKMKHKTEFIDKRTGKKSRMYKTDYSSGVQVWDAKKKKYVKHGVFLTFHSNKTVNEVITWNYGIKEGAYQRFSKKGVLTQEGVYSRGKKEGQWKSYTSKNGRISSKDQYTKGRRDGECISYNLYIKKRGQPQFIKQYKDGKQHGLHEQFNDKNKRVIWGPYVKGKRHGTWHEYGWNRELKSIQWVHGKRQKK